MNKEEILELLDELVSRIEGPAAAVYEIALSANIRGAIYFISIGAFMLLGGLGAFIFAALYERAARKRSETETAHDYYRRNSFDDISITANIVGGFAVFIGAIMLLLAGHDLLTVEWTTLRQLVPGL